MEDYSDEELNERHKEITNQLELADTEDLEREEKELEEDFDRHRHVCRQEYERKMTGLSQEYKRKMVELSQKQAKKKRLEEEELSIGWRRETRQSNWNWIDSVNTWKGSGTPWPSEGAGYETRVGGGQKLGWRRLEVEVGQDQSLSWKRQLRSRMMLVERMRRTLVTTMR